MPSSSASKSSLPKGWFSKGDIERYRYIYENLIPEGGFTAEVGCYLGRSICSVADIIQHRRITVFCVDKWIAWEEDEMEDQLEQFIANCRHAGLFENVHIYLQKGSSTSVASVFDLHSLHFVFIDADHSYDAVKADIQVWKPKVKQGFWIGGHDFPDFIGVARAVSELINPVEAAFNSTIWLHKVGA